MSKYGTGACGRFRRLDDPQLSFKSVFFKPYRSPSDALLEAASIVSGPVALSIILVFKFLRLGEELFDDIFTSTPKIKTNDEEEEDEEFEYKGFLKSIGILLLVIPFSPFINLAGFIGRSIASLFSEQESPEIDDSSVSTLSIL